jgi:hypothetical protein
MLKKYILVLGLLLDLKLLKNVFYFFINSHGYFRDVGWINSFKQNLPLDKNNDPIPWLSYPFIHFIDNRLKSTHYLFEYGSGNSTLYYAKKVKFVATVEHDQNWFLKFKHSIPNNVLFHYEPLEVGGKYCDYANIISHIIKKKFDIIVIDGRDRINCIKKCISALSEAGVIILDDSERTEYYEGVYFLTSFGWKRIDFYGISPGLCYKKCTTLFYRDKNCLGI